jgi:F5/8 type C domain
MRPLLSIVVSLIPESQLTVAFVDSEELASEEGAATNAIDSEVHTFWHTEYSYQEPAHPHTIVSELGGTYLVEGFRYLPWQEGSLHGTINEYQWYVSEDGRGWGAPAVTGRLAGDRTENAVTFPGTVAAS